MIQGILQQYQIQYNCAQSAQLAPSFIAQPPVVPYCKPGNDLV